MKKYDSVSRCQSSDEQVFKKFFHLLKASLGIVNTDMLNTCSPEDRRLETQSRGFFSYFNITSFHV